MPLTGGSGPSLEPSGPAPQGARLLEIFYLATPAFLAVDLILGVPIRVAALSSPGLRYAYYAFSMGCGVATHARPRIAPFVGLFESSINLLMLVLSIMLPIFALTDQVFADEALSLPFTPAMLGNVIISGTVLVASFHIHQGKILGGTGTP